MSDVAALAERFAPVSLDDLDAAAALRSRQDRKYLVPRSLLAELLPELDPAVRALDIDGRRAFRYQTVYFDTPDQRSYRDAARSRPRRFKVRTRSYPDAGTCFLEVKVRDRTGVTVKHRREHPAGRAFELGAGDAAFLDGCAGVADVRRDLRPVLVTRYVRTTLLDPGSGSRITIDTGLTAVRPDDGAAVDAGHLVVVETKSPDRPTPLDRLLWAGHRRPGRMSKYATLLAVLDPALPANKWNRTLRTHFDRRPRRPAPGPAVAQADSRPDLSPSRRPRTSPGCCGSAPPGPIAARCASATASTPAGSTPPTRTGC